MDHADQSKHEQTYRQDSLRLHATVQTRSGDLQGLGCGTRQEMSDIIDLDFSMFGLSCPLDPETGLLCGHAVHDPVVIVKAPDASSPHLLRAMLTQEKLLFELRVYRQSAEPPGRWEHVFTYNWGAATLLKYELHFGAQDDISSITEQLELQPGHATVTHEPSGITWFDDWPCLPPDDPV